MAHPENILLCAIMDEDQDYRKIALEKILLARRDAQVNQPILVTSPTSILWPMVRCVSIE